MKKSIKYLIVSAFTLLLALSIFPSHQVSAEETVYPIRNWSLGILAACAAVGAGIGYMG
ncbi:hypothetical protein SAMN04487792_0217 [Lactobacillus bombicola]|uniref:Uncharacterized protein n=1 Tax=Lactobacillus bombicola TaxID=1505723 RepID=A0A1I1R7M0_9LACO|nr:hypothetical protein [Lactobacillus bombicola]MCO6528114.1 hypothetical protein [Lactobacillus sp.]SFD30315.1 hypothetical protein SAMN04487792_0217 [Lactobacillus bombicola]